MSSRVAPPRIAIVGRPNVGKSTLFNRLAGRRVALVAETAGVTRDVREAPARIADLRFTALDTPGLEEAPVEALEGRMRIKAEQALADVAVVLFVIDAREGVTPTDRHFAAWLRKQSLPVVLVANKSEGRAGFAGIGEAFGLGFGDPVPLSAEHGEGLADLYAAIREHVPDTGEDEEESDEAFVAPAGDSEEETEEIEPGPLRLAIVGRPNVGKSTLVNALLGQERMLTGPEAGLTREAVPIDWQWKGRPVRLVDTAGLRKRGRIGEDLEKLSAADTIRAIRLAQAVVLVIDATQPVEHQDLSIARLAVEEGRALIIAANKWDIVDNPNKAVRLIEDRIEASLPQVAGVAAVRMSALEGENLDRLMAEVFGAVGRWRKRLPTAKLNNWLREALERHAPPALRGRRLKIRYMTQVKSRPPTFALFGSRVEDIPEDYLRYLIGGLRKTFNLQGTPIRVIQKEGTNPYEPKRRRAG
jgi:GTP-binding protein